MLDLPLDYLVAFLGHHEGILLVTIDILWRLWWEVLRTPRRWWIGSIFGYMEPCDGEPVFARVEALPCSINGCGQSRLWLTGFGLSQGECSSAPSGVQGP